MPEKLYHLEKGRYLMLRKYFKSYEVLIFLPSLLMAEILTFGYSIRLGFRGIRFKLMALLDGLEGKIEKESVDKSNLYESFCYDIPIDQLNFCYVDTLIKGLANYIFKWNLKVSK
jgi:hypothetical protein